MTKTWEVFALKYAERNTRTRNDSFVMDPHHDLPHAMDYFIWVLKSGTDVIVVDTGYEETEASRRNRPILDRPSVMLRDFGIDAAKVSDVIITHLHYDHAGCLTDFPKARLHVQASEMAYATGPCMCHDHLRMPFTGEHVCDMVRSLFAGRVRFCDGPAMVADGVETHLIGGHSRGLQCVRVRTARGWVVLASDASHYFENYRGGKIFPIVVDVQAMLDGFSKLRSLADSDDHIIPGHDPLVRALYPTVGESDRIVALHASPRVQP